MARWSSSASEPVERSTAPLGSGCREPLAWDIRPGFVCGAPRRVRRLLRGAQLALSALLLCWSLTWVHDLGGVLPLLLLMPLLAFGALFWRAKWRGTVDRRSSPTRRLTWSGPWPGQPEPRKLAAAVAGPQAEFAVDGEPVQLRAIWQMGRWLCVAWSDRGWGWVSLTGSEADLALPVLIQTARQMAPSSASPLKSVRTGGADAGEQASRMASSGAWRAAQARRRARNASADGGRDDIRAAPHQKATGAPLESRRPHGPA